MKSKLPKQVDTGPTYGRGFARMARNMGPDARENMRQQVLRDQAAALEKVGGDRVTVERDRTVYTDYPEPKKRKTRRKHR